ncbi:MAG: YheU family protein [Pseudomonadota bacterium]|nr:YheU family protein [Pseudomonadota bacterium]
MHPGDTNPDEEDQAPVAIPHTDLSPDALRGVVESFVLREGTEYGEREFTLDEKLAHVMHQLERGEAQIMFDPVSSSVSIVVTQKLGSRR